MSTSQQNSRSTQGDDEGTAADTTVRARWRQHVAAENERRSVGRAGSGWVRVRWTEATRYEADLYLDGDDDDDDVRRRL